MDYLGPKERVHLVDHLFEPFPRLADDDSFEVTSPPDVSYNCIAWAAGDTDVWWWPDAHGIYYWPSDTRREESITAFVQAFHALGFEECTDGNLDQGYEKVALFTLSGTPTHAARQLRDGRWSSKIGVHEDISHNVAALDGHEYGSIACFLRRRIEARKRTA